MNIVGFTGTREKTTIEQQKEFTRLLQNINISEFHHGDCTGWDELAHNIIRNKIKFNNHVKIVIHPPSYNKYRAYCEGDLILNCKPYLDRNKDIVDACDLLVACTKGLAYVHSGTWSTISYARKKNKLIYIIYPNGHIHVENL